MSIDNQNQSSGLPINQSFPNSNGDNSTQPNAPQPMPFPQQTDSFSVSPQVQPQDPTIQKDISKSKINKIIILLIILCCVGLFAYFGFFHKSTRVSTPQPTDTEDVNNNTNIAPPVDSSCKIFWVDPILPEEGNIEPLFLRTTNSEIATGFEAIIRRSVQNNVLTIDVVTNLLPETHSPYYLWAVATGQNDSICIQNNIGQLEKIGEEGPWGAGPFTIPVENVNDAQIFLITTNGKGSNATDKIESLSDPNIVLWGAYKDNQQP